MRKSLRYSKKLHKAAMLVIAFVTMAFSGTLYAQSVLNNFKIHDFTKVKGFYIQHEYGSLVSVPGLSAGELLASVSCEGADSIVVFSYNTYTTLLETDIVKSYNNLRVYFTNEYGVEYSELNIYVRDRFVGLFESHPYIRINVYEQSQSIEIAEGSKVDLFLQAFKIEDESGGELKLFKDSEKTVQLQAADLIYQGAFLEVVKNGDTTDYEIYAYGFDLYFHHYYMSNYCIGDTLELSKDEVGMLPLGSISRWYLNDVLVSSEMYPIIVLNKNRNHVKRVAFGPDGKYLGEHQTEEIMAGGSPGHFKFSTGNQTCPNTEVQIYFDDEIMDLRQLYWKIDESKEIYGNEISYKFDEERPYEVVAYLDFNECKDDTIRQIITASSTAVPTVDFESSGMEACKNDEMSFGVNRPVQGYTYQWVFEETIIKNGFYVTHAFPENGTYNVKLLVTNQCGQTGEKIKQINIIDGIQPGNNFEMHLSYPSCTGIPVVLRTYEPGQTYRWEIKNDYGELYMVASGKEATLNIEDEGNYYVSLTVMNGCGNVSMNDYNNQYFNIYRDENYITPVYFEIENTEYGQDTLSSPNGEFVEFRSEVHSDIPTKYYWDFGDGSPLDSVNIKKVSHQFFSSVDTVYTVTLYSVNACGGIDSTKRWIHVDPELSFNLPFTSTPDTICPGGNVAFYFDQFHLDSYEGYSFDIDFGDGSAPLTGVADFSNGIPEMEIVFDHKYETEGSFTWSAAVHSPGGNTSVSEGVVEVTTVAHKPFFYVGNSAHRDDIPIVIKPYQGDILISPTVENQDSVYFINIESADSLSGWYSIGTTPDKGHTLYIISKGTYNTDVTNKTISFTEDINDDINYCTGGTGVYSYSENEDGSNLLTLVSDDCPVRIEHLDNKTFFNPDDGGGVEDPNINKPIDGYVLISPTMENPDSVYFVNIEHRDSLEGWYKIGTTPDQGFTLYVISQGNYVVDTLNKVIHFYDDPNDDIQSCTDLSGDYNYMSDEYGQTAFMLINDACSERSAYLNEKMFFDPYLDDNTGGDDGSGGGDDYYYDIGVCPGDTVIFRTFGGVSYKWHYMGDEIEAPVTTSNMTKYVYNESGVYNPYVLATDACGIEEKLITQVNIAEHFYPNAYFKVSKDRVEVGEEVQFETDSWYDQQINIKYTWYFGDGTTSTELNPVHSYSQPGEYQVMLIAQNGCGTMEFHQRIWVIEMTESMNPMADAGESYTCMEGALRAGDYYCLDGYGSKDHQGGTDLAYNWIAPEGIVLEDPTSVSTCFYTPSFDVPYMELIFALEVTDNVSGETDIDFIKVCVQGRKTIYVDPKGDDYNMGTWDYPLATIQRAAEMSAPGDEIILKDGDYFTSNNVYLYHPVSINTESMQLGSVRIFANGMDVFTIGNTGVKNTEVRTTINGLIIKNANVAFRVESAAKISHCVIDSAYIGIDVLDYSMGTEINRNIIKSASYQGIIVGGPADILNNTIVGSDLEGSGAGQIYGDGGEIYMYNNIFAYNALGMVNTSTHTLFNDYNLYFNDASNADGITMGANSIVDDPLITDYIHYDFSLMAGSPAIDAGHPDTYDFDGTIADLGAVPSFQHNEMHHIPLTAGWNLISTYMAPNKPDLLDLMQPLIDAGKFVKLMNDQGKAIVKIAEVWDNPIGNGSNAESYLVRVTEDAVLTVVGQKTMLPVEVELLQDSWNFIGYPYNYPMPLMMLEPILPSVDKIMDEKGASYENVAGIGIVNNIVDLYPGEGYKVRANAFTTFMYEELNATKTASNKENPVIAEQHYYKPVYTGKGFDHMNLYVLDATINGQMLEAGDEIGVYDNGLCVGRGIVVEGKEFISIIASSNDPYTQQVDGFTEGNNIEFRLWDASEKKEYFALEADFEYGYPTTYSALGTTMLTLKALTTDVPEVESLSTVLHEVYPNPLETESTVSFSLNKELKVSIEVYDVLGRKVDVLIDGTYAAGHYQFKWKGTDQNDVRLNSGIYFIKMTAGNYSSVKQIMVSK